jgi:hypothetical protein
MKKNHESIIKFIQQALNNVSYDNALVETKKYLLLALQSVQKTAKKRINNETTRQFYEKQAKDKAKIWWEMIKKNAAENFNLDQEN